MQRRRPGRQAPFRCDGEGLSGLGNPFGLTGNKNGWMVEADPACSALLGQGRLDGTPLLA